MTSLDRPWLPFSLPSWAVCAALVGSSCAVPEDTRPFGLYDTWRRMEVQVEMDEQDWEALRHQGYSLFDHLKNGAREFDYSYFEATVTIDGRRLERVGVRKKGSVGSSSRLRPSLVLDLDRFLSDQEQYGETRLTLNNDQADAAHARQCLAYELFTRARLPASRCSLAHVTVNGRDMGTFTNVEPIRKPYLARHFGDDSGNLYEGRGNADFTLGSYQRFEVKTNEQANDKSDLHAVALAMEQSDVHLVEELDKVVDLEQFRRFWAVETLTANWDGYGGNQNNYLVYHDPSGGKFKFLPWGTDSAFSGDPSGSGAARLYTQGAIGRRLYGIPEERARFRASLRELVTTLYDTKWLRSRVSEQQALSTDAWPGDSARLRQSIQDYPDRLLDLLDMPASEQPPEEPVRDECYGQIEPVGGSFDTTLVLTDGMFGEALNGAGASSGFDARVSFDGTPIEAKWSGVIGREPNGRRPNFELDYIGLLPDGRQLVLALILHPMGLTRGTLPFYNYETFGMVYVRSADVPFDLVGWLSEGAIEWEDVGTTEGHRARGRFEGKIYPLKCFPR